MDVGITELEKIEATRVDGVETPANGIPILLLKSAAPAPEPGPEPGAGPEFDREAAKSLVRGIIAKAVGAGGEVDEEPDVEGGTHVLEMIADLIIAEAQELKAGQAGEICDILELACAAEKIWCWRTGEEAVSTGSVMPATALMQSAAGCGCCENCTAGTAEKSGPSAEERRKAASEGNALPDGSYPIRNTHELHSAAVLARSGHGDVAGAKRLIARRAKELGVANPLDDNDDDTSKSQIAKGEASVDTETQTGDLSEVVKAAVTEAAAPLLKRVDDLESSNKALAEELAKVKATPVPGGLVLSRNVQVKQPGAAVNEDYAAKAALYRAKAGAATSPQDRDGYLALARETEQRAKTPS